MLAGQDANVAAYLAAAAATDDDVVTMQWAPRQSHISHIGTSTDENRTDLMGFAVRRSIQNLATASL